MSYDGIVCRCGGKKLSGTLICSCCEKAFAQHPSMQAFNDEKNRPESRRHAAETLLTMATGRGQAVWRNRARA